MDRSSLCQHRPPCYPGRVNRHRHHATSSLVDLWSLKARRHLLHPPDLTPHVQMLPLIGSRDYLARLIHHLESHLPDDLVLDKNIFLGILLCLIAGQRNLIVDVDVDIDYEIDDGGRQRIHGRVGTSSKDRERRLQDRLEKVSSMCKIVSRSIPYPKRRDRCIDFIDHRYVQRSLP